LGTWLLLAIAWFATMGWRPLLEPDEGRYAEIPREMTVSGDWVTPRLDGLKYFEKPPLQYWATAVAYSLVGVTEAAARFWACGLAFLCIPLAYAFSRHLYGSSGVAAAAAATLAINPLFAIVGQLDTLDSAFCFFLTAAVFAYLRAGAEVMASAAERVWMLAAAALMGCAVLSKGIAALVLAGGTLAIHMALTRDVRPIARWHLAVTVPVFLLVCVPWFVVVSVRNPEFPQFFFIHEHFARYLTDVSERVQPWWFFLPLLFIAVLPWLMRVVPAARSIGRPAVHGNGGSARWFLVAWCGFLVLFFSISQSKLVTYILPVMPALAVLLAPAIAERKQSVRRAAWINAAIVVCFAVGLVVAGSRRNGAFSAEVWPGAAVAAAVAIVGALFSKKSWVVPAIASLLAFQALVVSYGAFPAARSAKRLVADARGYIHPQTRLFSVNQYRQSIPPYLGRTLELVIYRGELDFGLRHDNVRFMATLEAFIPEWTRQTDAVAFTDMETVDAMNSRGVPLRVVTEDGKTIVIVR
jgi:4-amino-4-deoxy-L-arabinose transferase-like glycosyltransferase